MKISKTEENYLKAIFSIIEKGQATASTNAISKRIQTSAASVTDMIKRLAKKKLAIHESHKGVKLTASGERVATMLIRKHRLWEVFLVDKLNFEWDEVHEMAEELEHIRSKEMINRLDDFLGNPKFDPHGDPIPDQNGKFTSRKQVILGELAVGEEGTVVGVREHSTPFLQYLNQLNLGLGAIVKIIEKYEFDNSVKILLNKSNEIVISGKVSQNLFLQKQ
ncbi:MAG: metal-dependent transcriptional regulator [Bacteroidota bacterium]